MYDPGLHQVGAELPCVPLTLDGEAREGLMGRCAAQPGVRLSLRFQ